MIPLFDKRGFLPPGKPYKVSWVELVNRFGINEHRRYLLEGMEAALYNLKSAGCEFVYIDGSFVTAKEEPVDWDGCWQLKEVNTQQVDLAIINADRFPDKMKQKYRGDLLVHVPMLPGGDFLSFFQKDRDGVAKGIIVIDLETLS